MCAFKNNLFSVRTHFKKDKEITDNYLNDILRRSMSREDEYLHILMVSFCLLIYFFLLFNIIDKFLK